MYHKQEEKKEFFRGTFIRAGRWKNNPLEIARKERLALGVFFLKNHTTVVKKKKQWAVGKTKSSRSRFQAAKKERPGTLSFQVAHQQMTRWRLEPKSKESKGVAKLSPNGGGKKKKGEGEPPTTIGATVFGKKIIHTVGTLAVAANATTCRTRYTLGKIRT